MPPPPPSSPPPKPPLLPAVAHASGTSAHESTSNIPRVPVIRMAVILRRGARQGERFA
jgi:hypothetical protein